MQITSFLPCDDLDASRRFYAGIGVAMTPRRRRIWPPSHLGATLLRLARHGDVPPAIPGRLVILVDDVPDVLARIPGLGGAVLSSDWQTTRIAVVADPAGNVLGITDVPH